jgi:hypothetical protein
MAIIPKRKYRVTRVVLLDRVNLATSNVLDFSNATMINFPPQATEIRLRSIVGHEWVVNNGTQVQISDGYRWALRTPNNLTDAIDPAFYVPPVMKIPISKEQINCDILFPSRNILQFELSNYSGVAIDGYCWVTMEWEFML